MGYRTGTDKTVYSTSKPVISFTPGSNTQVVAQFNMNLKRRSKAVKEYKLQWLYKVGNRRIEGSTDTVQAGANGASNSTDAIEHTPKTLPAPIPVPPILLHMKQLPVSLCLHCDYSYPYSEL